MKKKIALVLVFCMIITCFSGVDIAFAKDTSSNSTMGNVTSDKDDSYEVDKTSYDNSSEKDNSDKDKSDKDDSSKDSTDKSNNKDDKKDSDTKNTTDSKKDTDTTVDVISYPEFNPLPVKVDDVYVNVSAEAGVFPEGATLKVTKVTDLSKIQADMVVDKVDDSTKKIAKSYTYDIKIIDKDGVTELEPLNNKKVNVTFTAKEVSDANLDTEVYHIVEEKIPEDKNKLDKEDDNLKLAKEDKNALVDESRRVKITADKLSLLEEKDITNGTVKDSAFLRDAMNNKETVAVNTSSFSFYTVNFTYSDKTYVLDGGSITSLDAIKDAVGLVGVIENATVSNNSLLNIYTENNKFYIKSLKSFKTSERLTLTINGINYEILITDPEVREVTTWTELQNAIDDSNDGDTIRLLNDIDANENKPISVDKEGCTITIDLNDKKLNRNLSDSEGSKGHVIEVNSGSLIIKDTGDNGEITGGYADNGGGIYIHDDCTVTIEGGKITNNKAEDDAGGIFVKGTLIMTGGYISGNTAGGSGAAIYTMDDSRIELSNVQITGNEADDKAGAIYLDVVSDSSLTNCTISNNKAKSDYGGAIYMDSKNKTLTIIGTHFDGNTADDDGGAIYLERGSIVMTGGEFRNNKSDNDSGAVKVTSNTSFSATATTFSGNVAESEEAGALKNKGNVTLTSCTIEGNTAHKEGGAIWNDSEMTLVDCTFTTNSSAVKGGAIFSDDKLTINGITMTGNSTRGNGGAIFVGGSSDPVKIQGLLKIKDNDANDGKNIYLREDRTLMLMGDIGEETEVWLTMEEEKGIAVTNYATFRPKTETDLDNTPTKFFKSDNYLGVKRGGKEEKDVELYSGWKYVQEMLSKAEDSSIVKLYADYSATSDDSSLKVNTGKTFTLDLNGHTLNRNLNDDENNGHVIDVGNGNLTIIDSSTDNSGTITGGYAKEGGGIVIGGEGTCTINGGNITGNKAEVDGGGIKNYGTLTINGTNEKRVIISENYAKETGGGIYNHVSGTINLSYVDITGNTAREEGGGLKLHPANDPVINSCNIIKNNSETDRAGGINLASGNSLTITNSNISDNTSSGPGAGIYLEDNGTINLESTQFNTNQSSNGGGAVKTIEGSTINVSNCSFNNNKATDEYGGGILALGTATITSCDFTGNQSSKEGGAIYNGGTGDMTIKNCGITNNLSWTGGGGIYSNKNLSITYDNDSKKITGNTASRVGGGLYVDGSSTTTLNGVNTITGNSVNNSSYDIYVNNNSATLSLSDDFNAGASPIVIDGADRSKEVTSGKALDTAAPFMALKGFDIGLNDQSHVIIIQGKWKDLQDEIDAAEDGGTINVDRDYTAIASDKRLEINKDLTINLNGHTLNRNLGSKTDEGQVININEGKTLTINDTDNSGTITGGFDKKGSGIMIQEDATLNFNGGTIRGNKADVDGGAVYVKGTLNMTKGVISDNYADDTAGAIYCDSTGVFNISNVTITNNSAKNAGGALNIHSNGDVNITDCNINGNASGDIAGAIKMDTDHKLTITGTSKDKMTIDGNNSGDDGGAIYLQKGEIVMNTGSISSNVSTNDSGAVKVTTNTDFTASNVDFNNNTASREEAGAIKAWSHVTLTNCNLSGNNSAKEGGAIDVAYDDGFFSDDYGTLTLNNTSIINNNSFGEGGGVHADGGSLIINGATITGNSSGGTGGGVYVGYNIFDFTVSGQIIIKDNIAPKYGNNLYMYNKMQLTNKLLDGTDIRLELSNNGGFITEDYSDYNDGDEPSIFFKSDQNYDVYKKDGEAYIDSSWSELEDLIEETPSGGTIVLTKDYAASIEDEYLLIEDGKNLTIDLNGHTINRNLASVDEDSASGARAIKNGNVFYVDDNAVLTITDSVGTGVITGGKAKKGGAFYIDDDATVNISGGIIKGNTAQSEGGAIYVNRGVLNISGGEIRENEADDAGGIYLNATYTTLNLTGGTITANTSLDGKVGGIYVKNKSVFNMSSSPDVSGNIGGDCKDVYLESDEKINIVGPLLDDAHIVVGRDGNEGQITYGYGANQGSKSPSKYFTSSMGYGIYLESGEVVLGYNMQGETDKEYPFIEPGSQINTDVGSLSNVNWMSGISGERYLHEINMPITHDSSMNKVESKWFDWTMWYPVGPLMHKLAKTQIEYIDEQMNDGIRKFDLRLNPVYKKYYGAGYWWHDDGENLFMCHGKTKFGTSQALNRDDSYLKFNNILDWSAEFLRNHPTETIILDLSAELDVDYQNYKWESETFARAGRILSTFAREINPSTGESYLYKEDEADSYLAPYTHMPQLKDCRGKVVIMSNNNYLDKTGGMTLESVGIQSWGGQSYKIGPDDKILETKEHYTDLQRSFGHSEDNPLELSSKVEGPSNYLWSFGLNVTNQESDIGYIWRRINLWDDCAPYEYAETVNGALFGDGKLFASSGSTDKSGEYLGWVSMDGAKDPYGKDVWGTNFYAGLESAYVTVTVEPPDELKDLGYSTQEYKLLKGTSIKIPGNIYKGLDGKYLDYWMSFVGAVPSMYFNPGEILAIDHDITFKPVFLKEGEVPVSIDWQDSNNADGLRDKKINFTVTSTDAQKSPYGITLSAEKNYRYTLNEKQVNDIVPNWEKILITDVSPRGIDGPYQYRYEMTKDPMEGYVFKFIHTSDKKQSINGTITWVDDDNSAKTRPNSVTVSLYEEGNDIPKATTTVVADTAGNWYYSFNDLPIYVNGDKINYVIKTNTIDNYYTSIDGYNITNVLNTSTGMVEGFVVWDDDNNALDKRPDSVTINLFANNVMKASQAVNTNEAYFNTFYFDNAPEKDNKGRAINYSISEDLIQDYETIINKGDDGTMVVINRLMKEDEKRYKLDVYSSNKECKASIVEPKVSPKSFNDEYNEDTEITLTAETKYGYKFLGWYNVTGVRNGLVTSYGELVNADKSFTFKINNDAALVAVYEPNIVDAMKPVPKNTLKADKTSKELLFYPLLSLPEGYTMQYALSASETKVPADASFKTDMPKGYDAGRYYVWFKPVGDAYHNDLPAECLIVDIEQGAEPGGNYEDVPVTPGEVNDITGTEDAPEESNPNDAHVDDLDNLPITEDDIEMGVNVWVSVREISASDLTAADRMKIANACNGYNIAAYYDINLYLKVGLLEPVQIRNMLLPVTISFNSNNRLSGGKIDYGIVRLHEGVARFLQLIYDQNNDRVFFASNGFSPYALVYKDKPVDPINPNNPNDPNNTGGNNTSNDTITTTTTITVKKAAKTKDEFNIVSIIKTFINSFVHSIN